MYSETMLSSTLKKPLLKKSVAAMLAGAFLAAQAVSPIPAMALDTLKGSVIETRDTTNNPSVNYDDIREVEDGTVLDLQLSTAISTDISAEGDEFFAKIVKDYKVGDMVVIPHGTLVHGIISEVEGPKRAGRKAWVQTEFDYMITPDGREIPIEGGYTNRDSKGKAVLKTVGRAVGYTAVGGVVGALMSLKYGGLPLVAATEGWSLAGAAAVGGVAGLTTAMIKKGGNTMIPPGAEIQIRLTDPLTLPTMDMPDESAENFSIPGLEVDVLGYRIGEDPFGETTELTMTLKIENYTEHTFSTFEIGLEDEYGNVFFPSPFGDTGMWFRKLGPNNHITANITFNVDDPNRRMKLVFFKQYTREPVAKFALTSDLQVDKKTLKKLRETAAAR